MKAVRLTKPGSPLELQDVPVPEPSHGDVLVSVRAAGICHSDAHYRAGKSRVDPLPLTLGHEVAGTVARVGPGVTQFKPEDRVCVHYLASCGHCTYCDEGSEQFCTNGKMIGKYRDGGYAEYILIPARSLFLLPAEIPFEQGAVMMCSSATSLHAVRKARLRAGETVAIFGAGGLGLSALQLANTMGASRVFAVDIDAQKLARAQQLGATPIDASKGNPVDKIRDLTEGRGADVSLELVGLPLTMKQAVDCLAIKGRAAMVGIGRQPFAVDAYEQLINREAEIIGVSDHLASEIPLLIDFVKSGKLNLSDVITTRVPLQANIINQTLDGLERFAVEGRTVIIPS
jgi:2-desacetyl-2-hydroxyethyl bacteriochlorophyllide A dehydrogenase